MPSSSGTIIAPRPSPGTPAATIPDKPRKKKITADIAEAAILFDVCAQLLRYADLLDQAEAVEAEARKTVRRLCSRQWVHGLGFRQHARAGEAGRHPRGYGPGTGGGVNALLEDAVLASPCDRLLAGLTRTAVTVVPTFPPDAAMRWGIEPGRRVRRCAGVAVEECVDAQGFLKVTVYKATS